MRNLLLFCTLLLLMPQYSVSESCLPSWFRQERSAPEPLQSLENSENGTENSGSPPSEDPPKNALETNEIGEAPEVSTTPPNTAGPSDFPTPGDIENDDEKLAKELTKQEADYEDEYEEEKVEEDTEEELKYNEHATRASTTTMKPSVQREIEKLKVAKCKDYCHHNATCHVEVIFDKDDRVLAVVPSCHCPHGWEGTRCDRHYVQAFYAPIQEKQSSTSAIPAFAFLIIMLVMLIAIVVYAYRRMSKRSDDMTYTMSHMCPPEAFNVLKTPNGRHIHQIHSSCPHTGGPSITVTPSTPHPSSTPTSHLPLRQSAVRSVDQARNNFFSILRSQGTIPSRSLNDDDTPKHYKSVPRVEVSAINYSGHIDFSTISFQSVESEVSKASSTCPPPTHTVINIEQDATETIFRSPSRTSGEPGSPATCEPMIPPMKP